MKVYSETKTGSDGKLYEVPYLLTLEHLAGLQAAGIVGEVDEILGMQEVADQILAGMEKQVYTASGGLTQ